MDLNDFAHLMARRAANLPKNVNDMKIRAAEVTLISVVTMTPADTSKALSNWQVGLGSPVLSEREAYVVGSQGSTKAASVRATIASGKAIMDQALPGQVIHISNSVSYIQDLNNGTSTKAPAAFVQTAIMLGRNELKSASFKLISD